MELRNPGKRDIVLGAVVPHAQTQATYRAALEKAVANMAASYEYWLQGKYKRALAANQKAGRLPDPERAADAAPGPSESAGDMFDELARLRDHWAKYFDTLAGKLAAQAAKAWYEDNTRSWAGKLKRAGFDIELKLSPAQKLILKAKVPENVALIQSIPQQYHKDVEGIVSRNFLKGRDLATMADEIKARGGVETRRAAFIALDQSNKATAQMNAARQSELGLTWATWIHSSAGKEPREKHVKAGREQWIFDTQTGIDFGDQFGQVLPGEAIRCRCHSGLPWRLSRGAWSQCWRKAETGRGEYPLAGRFARTLQLAQNDKAARLSGLTPKKRGFVAYSLHWPYGEARRLSSLCTAFAFVCPASTATFRGGI
jgi:hypothetical protein